MNFIDLIIIVVLIIFIFKGVREGFIFASIRFIGAILILILSFFLKNLFFKFLYYSFPIFKLNLEYEGINVVNIFIYEALSFVIAVSLLSLILVIILKIAKKHKEKIKDKVVAEPLNKYLGGLAGFLQGYFVTFIALFIVFVILIISPKIKENPIEKSAIGMNILTKTPIISKKTNKVYDTMDDIHAIRDKYNYLNNKEGPDLETLDLLLKYKIITPCDAEDLLKNQEIDLLDADKIIEKYKK